MKPVEDLTPPLPLTAYRHLLRGLVLADIFWVNEMSHRASSATWAVNLQWEASL